MERKQSRRNKRQSKGDSVNIDEERELGIKSFSRVSDPHAEERDGVKHKTSSSAKMFTHLTDGNPEPKESKGSNARSNDAAKHQQLTTAMKRSTRSQTPRGPRITPDNVACNLVQFLVRRGGSEAVHVLTETLNLYKEIKAASPDNTLKGFVDSYHLVFELATDSTNGARNSTLTFKGCLQICSTHTNNVGACSGQCGSLHICKFKMLSKCDRKKKCLFNHDLKDQHNRNVLKMHFMNRLSDGEIQTEIRNPFKRQGPTIPIICKFYNSKRGCRKSRQQQCPYLHICKYFILDSCKYGSKQCNYSHDLYEEQPSFLLQKYGLRGNIAKSDLKEILRGGVESDSDLDDDMSHGYPESDVSDESFRYEEDETTEEDSDDTAKKPVTYRSILGQGSSSDVESDQGLWEITNPMGDHVIKLTDAESKTLEQLYRRYVQAKKQDLSLGGRKVSIDFEKMEGTFMKSKRDFSFQMWRK